MEDQASSLLMSMVESRCMRLMSTVMNVRSTMMPSRRVDESVRRYMNLMMPMMEILSRTEASIIEQSVGAST